MSAIKCLMIHTAGLKDIRLGMKHGAPLRRTNSDPTVFYCQQEAGYTKLCCFTLQSAT